MRRVQTDKEKMEFFEIRNKQGDLLWVELRGGHHRAIALYAYLHLAGRPTTVGELEKICRGACEWKTEQASESGGLVGALEKVPVAGTYLQEYSGRVVQYDSPTAPTFRTNGNNRTRTDVTIGESAFATLNSLTSQRPIGYFSVSRGSVRENGGLQALLDRVQSSAEGSRLFEVVLFAEDLGLRMQTQALLSDPGAYRNLNLYRKSLAGEKAYMRQLEHFGIQDLIPLRLTQIYQWG